MNDHGYEISFTELRCKEVVNACDGRRLGRITDLVFSNESGKIRGIVTPYSRRGMFGKGQDIFIPWHCVKKLGEDVIIVDVSTSSEPRKELPPPAREHQGPPCGDDPCGARPDCDHRCDKCMLFDCEYRWKQ